MVLGQQVELIILHHLSHPTLVGGLKDDESDGGHHLKAKVGRNLAKFHFRHIHLFQIPDSSEDDLSGVG